MTRNRFISALVAAGIAATIILLIPRYENQPVQFGPELAEPTPVTVIWPSPPSASPLTSEPPLIVIDPSDPQAAVIFRAVNERRVAVGLRHVLIDETLNRFAQLHADDMARRTYLEHTTPEGVTFEMRINASGYAYSVAAENLGFASHVELIVPDWMRSPAHRMNLENPIYRRVGVATAQGKWQDIDVVYVVMVFTQPR